jgi:hypothetical protein
VAEARPNRSTQLRQQVDELKPVDAVAEPDHLGYHTILVLGTPPSMCPDGKVKPNIVFFPHYGKDQDLGIRHNSTINPAT